MKPFRVLMLSVLILSCVGLSANEGMWMPQQIPALAAKLRALGFVGDPKSFADLTGQPMGAIVSLGGCTASFVSPDGLIVTNHHCVTGGLQFNSTPQRNLLQDGYLAQTRGDELSNGPGSRVFVTTSVVDVTAAITGGIDPKATDRERYDTIDRRAKERIAACEKDGRVAAWRRSSRASSTSRSRSSKSRTCAWSTRRPKASACLAARPTTGAGRATPATGASSGPTSPRTASPRRIPRTTCRTSPSTGSGSRLRASSPTISSSWSGIRAARCGTRPTRRSARPPSGRFPAPSAWLRNSSPSSTRSRRTTPPSPSRWRDASRGSTTT